MRISLHPNTLAFPIFWLPLVVPLFLAALAVIGDSAGAQASITIAFSILKNIHLAYISFDLWALTAFAVAGTRLKGPRALSYFSAAMIALLFHTLSYLHAALFVPTSLNFVLGLVLAVVGGIGVLLIRVAVFQRIETVELFSRP